MVGRYGQVRSCSYSEQKLLFAYHISPLLQSSHLQIAKSAWNVRCGMVLTQSGPIICKYDQGRGRNGLELHVCSLPPLSRRSVASYAHTRTVQAVKGVPRTDINMLCCHWACIHTLATLLCVRTSAVFSCSATPLTAARNSIVT